MSRFIKVAEDLDEEPIEIPCEGDSTVLLTTLTSQFPGASGLKYRNEESGTMRGLRLIDGKLQAPEDGWDSISVYYCCFPKENKRKIEDQSDSSNTKTKRVEEKKKCSDLIVLGLAWKTTDKELKEYFEQYGELLMAQVKKDPRTGQSKGFGFIRFADYEKQRSVLATRHYIEGRYCDVRVPMSKDGNPNERNQENVNRKIFIGRITEEITYNDLRDYFIKYGEIADIFIPRPFRGFAFITFKEADIVDGLCGDDHIIKGISVYVSTAVPKIEMNAREQALGYSSKPSYGRGYGYSSSYSTTNNHGSMSPPGHPPPGNYSPSARQYGEYWPDSRHRSANHHSYPESGTPYGSRYGSPDYSSYY